MSNEKEYIVTVKEGVDWKEVHHDLTRDTAKDSSVDSNIVPDRTVDVIKLRRQNKRNTHYNLNDLEAQRLKNDSRIQDVAEVESMQVGFYGKQLGSFTREFPENNWGLVRHTSTNIFPPHTIYNGGTEYNYVLDGTGVDIVIQDTGIQADHPEFQDADGNSRVQQIDWSKYDGDWRSDGRASNYTDNDGHGTHVASTAAGKTYGWAKNAHIFSQKLAEAGGMNNDDAFDSLLGWHNSKAGSRPTVVNMSYGFLHYLAEVENGQGTAVIRIIQGVPFVDGVVTGGRFRGSTNSITQLSFWRGRGIGATFLGSSEGIDFYSLDRRLGAFDADVQQCVDAGIVFTKAAGNDNHKMDVPGGIDFDNKLTSEPLPNGIIRDIEYARGSSPMTDTGDDIIVGALSSSGYGLSKDERRSSFSVSGPGVDLYAAGQNILGALSQTFADKYRNGRRNYGADRLDESGGDPAFNETLMQGTSMAAPQVAGMCACILQAHPDWTPKQVKSYLVNNAVTNQMFTPDIEDNDLRHFTNGNVSSATLNGGPNRIAYLPMNGASPFGYSSS